MSASIMAARARADAGHLDDPGSAQRSHVHAPRLRTRSSAGCSQGRPGSKCGPAPGCACGIGAWQVDLHETQRPRLRVGSARGRSISPNSWAQGQAASRRCTSWPATGGDGPTSCRPTRQDRRRRRAGPARRRGQSRRRCTPPPASTATGRSAPHRSGSTRMPSGVATLPARVPSGSVAQPSRTVTAGRPRRPSRPDGPSAPTSPAGAMASVVATAPAEHVEVGRTISSATWTPSRC